MRSVDKVCEAPVSELRMHLRRALGTAFVFLVCGFSFAACSDKPREGAGEQESSSSQAVAQQSVTQPAASAGAECGNVDFNGKPGEVIVVQGTIPCDEALQLIAGAFDNIFNKQLNGTLDYKGWQCGMVGPDPETSTSPYDYHCVSADRATIVGHKFTATTEPGPPPAATNTPAGCGSAPEFPNLEVTTSGELSCPDAIALISRYATDPRTQRGDRGAQVGDWACNILGAAEAERAGHVITCARPDGAAVTVGPPNGDPGAESTVTTPGPCSADIGGTNGTVTIVGGVLDCADAQAIIAERDGKVGYFKGPNGTAWACGSDDILASYECYSTAGAERFTWEPSS